jgi:surface protein
MMILHFQFPLGLYVVITMCVPRMDVVTMVLIETKTRIPLDLVIFINSFLYEKLTDDNFKEAIDLWFENEKNCRWRFGQNSFYEKGRFNEDLSRWNVGKVTNMKFMLTLATKFNGDLNRWDVSNVMNMLGIFIGAFCFNGDLSEWDVSNVTNMSDMFAHAIRFNGNISRWNVSSVNNMNHMFSGASRFNCDISQWDVSRVTDMTSMFQGANKFNGDLSHWEKLIDKNIIQNVLNDVKACKRRRQLEDWIEVIFVIFHCIIVILLFLVMEIFDALK